MKNGLYEKVIDDVLASELEGLSKYVQRESLDPADSHIILAQHLGNLIANVLRRLPSQNRLQNQRELVNQIVTVLSQKDKNLEQGASLPEKLERLMAVADDAKFAVRPETPLSETSLLTGTRIDPSLLSQLKQELATADRVDILCSFIKWSGIGLLRDALEDFTRRPNTRLRVLTTSYMGATELNAVKSLASLPQTEVKISYDVHRTRLHAKAYLFERHSSFSTAYIGSANLSRPALTEGLEWTVKVTQCADKPIWDKVLATFETYWEDAEFEAFNEERLREALKLESGKVIATSSQPLFELRPYQFQQEVLDSLADDRIMQEPPHKQLVVAATGTGKTMIAAFDYRRIVNENGGTYPSLLVVAHRREILQQALHTFRAVLRDQNFGELMDGYHDPENKQQLFASVQTLHRRDLPRKWSSDVYDYVVIDETHRSTASSYRGILDLLKPKILLGLTATPERADGEDVLRYFDNRIVSEIRLSDAINRRLVVPFHYYGLSDTAEMDYTQLTWERGGYRVSELDNLVTGNHIRAQNIVDQCNKRLSDVRAARGIGFCVSVRHAEFMADFFNKSDIPALALSTNSPKEVRDGARQHLRTCKINFIFVVDIFNEGVDIPEVDTVLFLRPTESLTVFLQQLGRGLRLTDSKDYLTVFDFVGQMHRKFRYDQRLRALMSKPDFDLNREIYSDFPHLPAGCSIQLERVARERVLKNIRESILSGVFGLVRNVLDFSRENENGFSLENFLDYCKVEPDDVYRRDTWTGLCKRAGIDNGPESPDNRILAKWLRRIIHANDFVRLTRWQKWLHDGEGEDPLILALLIPLVSSTENIRTAADAWALLQENSDIHEEAKQLIAWRLNKAGLQHGDGLSEEIPLVVHACYTRDEILVLCGVWNWQSQTPVREGVRHVPERKLDLFFATLQKSEKNYSPSTLYEDYAISSDLFHWQSQSTTGEDSPTGKRYINHSEMGYRPLLFVRSEAKVGGYSQPYHFLGAVDYQHHDGTRPMSITWELRRPMPARLLRNFQSLAVAG
ncbi:DEAD/DEAH box helicase [Microbulbifer hainanensis]|uniref:DEAD/DEAH box helicase n=1 Tax=Microbulbifer hainanensis TaxID=2735675 RepID=UPI0018671082|nr:DEAD/DEAH box helicase [Microbulbifer hainanensis]